MQKEHEIHEFFRYGCQYYVAGRYGVFASLIPVAANLHQHAIEMLLKGALSKSMSLKDVRNKFLHRLEDIWKAFKEMAGDEGLSRFDDAIRELNKFEDIRYPDKLIELGASMLFDVTKAGAAMASISGTDVPHYKFCLQEIDELVGVIFRIGSRNPDAYLKSMMRKETLEYLTRDNNTFK